MRSAITAQLRTRGLDALSTTEANRANQQYSDEEQLVYATDAGRVLVTEDSDFVVLSASVHPHAGIVYFPVQLSIGACVEYLELLALTTHPEEMRNQLIFARW